MFDSFWWSMAPMLTPYVNNYVRYHVTVFHCIDLQIHTIYDDDNYCDSAFPHDTYSTHGAP